DNIGNALGAAGDVAQLERDGRLVLLDASETMAQFFSNGVPDRSLFREHIGGLLQRIQQTVDTAPIHIYGEMVDVLWKAGDVSAVLQLEDLWNELAQDHRFSLLCGYVFKGFADGEY